MTVKEFYESCKLLGIEDYELRHTNWYQDMARQRPLDNQPLNLDDIQISDNQRVIEL